MFSVKCLSMVKYQRIGRYKLKFCVYEKEETAFYYRDALFILGFQSVWEDSKYGEVNHEWVGIRFNELSKYTNGSFVNFPIAQSDEYEKNYYGENLSRLKEVKRKYDKEQVFNFEQVIKVGN